MKELDPQSNEAAKYVLMGLFIVIVFIGCLLFYTRKNPNETMVQHLEEATIETEEIIVEIPKL